MVVVGSQRHPPAPWAGFTGQEPVGGVPWVSTGGEPSTQTHTHSKTRTVKDT